MSSLSTVTTGPGHFEAGDQFCLRHDYYRVVLAVWHSADWWTLYCEDA